MNAPEMLTLARQKISKPLLTASVRCICFADTLRAASSLLHKMNFSVQQSFASSSNALVPLSYEDYTLEQRVTDIYLRTSHRFGMLLNTEELSLLIHLPSPALLSKKVLGRYRKTKLPPPITEGYPFVLGSSDHGGEHKQVTLESMQRLKHVHIIGATGTGKSTLLLSMLKQDMELRNGVAVLDPHGDLVETILQHIPAHRMKDVVLLDPSDSEFPVGFNILQAHSEIEKETLSSDLVGAFKRLSTSWGDQMHSVLSNAILAFLESSKGGTLIDLRRFLLETSFRNEFLKTVNDYSILYYWQKQYPILKSGSIGPILTRLDNFLRSRLVRNMVAQRKGLNFEQILDEQKILLVKLSQGLIGEENAYLLGSFVVSKIHQAALARQAKTDRKDFFFYIDEFQHFTTPSMAAILSGARKYHLGLVLAHQDLQQLSRGDSELSSSVLSNAGTRICFRLGDSDAKKLAEGFSSFDAADLQNLSTGEAIGRIDKPEYDFSFNTIPLEEAMQSNETKAEIISYSRSLYAIPKASVEGELLQTVQADIKPDLPIKPKVINERPIDIPGEAEPHTASEKLHTPIELSEEKVGQLTNKLVKQKEQSQHRYIQNLIKRIAESKGYKATIEALLPSRDGQVDVLLEHGDIRIACEVSVTTGADWEMHNIQKCLSAGYTHIVSCVAEAKSSVIIERKIESTFTKEERKKIKVLQVESLITYLDTLVTGEMKHESTIKGYRVTVSHNATSGEAQKQKKDAVARVVGEALKRKKKV